MTQTTHKIRTSRSNHVSPMIRRSTHAIHENHENHENPMILRWIRAIRENPMILRWIRANPRNRTILRKIHSSRKTRTSDSAARPRCWSPEPTRPLKPVHQTTSSEPFDSPPELKQTANRHHGSNTEPGLCTNAERLTNAQRDSLWPDNSVSRGTNRPTAQAQLNRPTATRANKRRNRQTRSKLAQYTESEPDCNRES
jgi:hypothetical protein